MTATHWLTIAGILVGAFVALYLAFKRGDLKKIKIYVTPSRLKKGLADIKFFKNLKHKIPAVGILNFFLLPNSKYKRICYHIFLTIENPTKNHIEEVTLVISYPRQLCDEKDNHFFKPAGSISKNEPEVVFIDAHTVQVSYMFESLHPMSVRQVIHPIIISIEECFKEIEVENQLIFDTQAKDFSFHNVNYMVTGKNLRVPIRNHFWLINIIGSDQNKFFTREKKFLHAITRNFKFERYFFEKRAINKFIQGKNQRDVLVVDSSELNIEYSSFAPLKEPTSGTFNFEKIE